MIRPELPSIVETSGVVAVLRAESAADYLDVCTVLADAGIVALELTLTTPGTIEMLPTLRSALPHAVFGVGTVTTDAEASAAIDAGASFLVSPATIAGPIGLAVAAGVPILPGALSPTEVLSAWSLGASAVKIFPAVTVGAGYLSQLSGPFPDIRTMPSGGVGIDDIPAWIRAGAVAVSLGGPLLADAFRGGDPSALADRAARALAAVRSARALTA